MASNNYFTLFAVFFVTLLGLINESQAVRCYQCASGQDPKGQDNCGAYRAFRREQHIAVECNSEESHMPGSFCMKVTQQGPKGFVWDGRWRQIIRRCASVADTGVTGVCNWGVYDNGIYWEECYCSADECNSSNTHRLAVTTAVFTALTVLVVNCVFSI